MEFPSTASGTMTSGGAMANLLAHTITRRSLEVMTSDPRDWVGFARHYQHRSYCVFPSAQARQRCKSVL